MIEFPYLRLRDPEFDSVSINTTNNTQVLEVGGSIRATSIFAQTSSGTAEIYVESDADQAAAFGIRSTGANIWSIRRLASGVDLKIYNFGTSEYIATFEHATGNIYFTRDLGIGISSSLDGKLHVDQESNTGAKPVLTLDQADVSEQFIKFIGESAADNSQSLVDASDLGTPGSVVGWLKVQIVDVKTGGGDITDGDYWIPFYNTPTT